VLFSSVMLGAIYGGASLYFNTLPMPGDFPPDGVPSARWEPSAIWLPSWSIIESKYRVCGMLSWVIGLIASFRMRGLPALAFSWE